MQRFISLATLTALILLVVLAAIIDRLGDQRHSASARQEKSSTATPVATHPPLEPTYAAMIAARRDPDILPLPFPDNPDPSLCGIPTAWGPDNQAWLTGVYAGEMVQHEVLLYDSHLRLEIAARAAHGSEVEVLLYQQNPVTDYYLVKIAGAPQPNEGWVPGPFLSFNPVVGN